MVHLTIVLVCFLALILERGNFASAYVNPVQSAVRFHSVANLKSINRPYGKLTMTLESQTSSSEDNLHGGRSFLENIRAKMPSAIRAIRKFAVPLVLQLAVMVLFTAVNPALAKVATKKAASKVASKAGAVAVKAPPLWKKILEGEPTHPRKLLHTFQKINVTMTAIVSRIDLLIFLCLVKFLCPIN